MRADAHIRVRASLCAMLHPGRWSWVHNTRTRKAILDRSDLLPVNFKSSMKRLMVGVELMG